MTGKNVAGTVPTPMPSSTVPPREGAGSLQKAGGDPFIAAPYPPRFGPNVRLSFPVVNIETATNNGHGHASDLETVKTPPMKRA